MFTLKGFLTTIFVHLFAFSLLTHSIYATEEDSTHLEFELLEYDQHPDSLTQEYVMLQATPSALLLGATGVGALWKWLPSGVAKIALVGGVLVAVIGSEVYKLTAADTESVLEAEPFLTAEQDSRRYLYTNLVKTHKKIKRRGPEEERLLLADLRKQKEQNPGYSARRKFLRRAIMEIEDRQAYYDKYKDPIGWKRLVKEDIEAAKTDLILTQQVDILQNLVRDLKQSSTLN